MDCRCTTRNSLVPRLFDEHLPLFSDRLMMHEFGHSLNEFIPCWRDFDGLLMCHSIMMDDLCLGGDDLVPCILNKHLMLFGDGIMMHDMGFGGNDFVICVPDELALDMSDGVMMPCLMAFGLGDYGFIPCITNNNSTVFDNRVMMHRLVRRLVMHGLFWSDDNGFVPCRGVDDGARAGLNLCPIFDDCIVSTVSHIESESVNT